MISWRVSHRRDPGSLMHFFYEREETNEPLEVSAVLLEISAVYLVVVDYHRPLTLTTTAVGLAHCLPSALREEEDYRKAYPFL